MNRADRFWRAYTDLNAVYDGEANATAKTAILTPAEWAALNEIIGTLSNLIRDSKQRAATT